MRSVTTGGNGPVFTMAPFSRIWCSVAAKIPSTRAFISMGSRRRGRPPSLEIRKMAEIRLSMRVMELLINPKASSKSLAEFSGTGWLFAALRL